MRWSPFELERFFARYEFNVDHVLCASDCESMTVAELLELEPGAAQRFQSCWLGYTESTGDPALREAISAIYDTVDPANVLVYAGAEEAIFLFAHAALEAGDHVVVQWPCYQSLMEVARGLGCHVTPWRARWDDGWIPDVDELARLVTPATRAIVINSPHNPTGYQMPRIVFDKIVALAERNGALLFSDEVYREAEYRLEDRLPAACDVSPLAISLGVMSKTYGLAGLRIGWISTHYGDLLQRMAQLKDYTTICNSAPSEFLAGVALRHREVLVTRTVDLLRRNLAHLDAFMARHCEVFEWQRPGGGPIAFPALAGRAVEMGADAFCEDLVRKSGVLLLPGTVYGVPGHVRVGFGRRDLPEALARLDAVW